MMPKILFKGFRPYEYGDELICVNMEWVRGYWVKGDYIGCKNIIREQKSGVNFKVIPETVVQFTGLFDSTTWEELTADEQAEFLCSTVGGERLKDEWRGREVFDGDVMAWFCEGDSDEDNEIISHYLIVRRESPAGFFTKCLDLHQECFDELDIAFCKSAKIIGNLYSNPELVGGEV